jgi:hypothetical protein
MDSTGLILLVEIVLGTGIVVLLYFYVRRKKTAVQKIDPVLEAKIQELRNRGMPEEAARNQATLEYQAAMRARQKKTSIIMGAIWMAIGVVFALINGLDISSIALVGLGAIQLVSGLLVKTEQK